MKKTNFIKGLLVGTVLTATLVAGCGEQKVESTSQESNRTYSDEQVNAAIQQAEQESNQQQFDEAEYFSFVVESDGESSSKYYMIGIPLEFVAQMDGTAAYYQNEGTLQIKNERGMEYTLQIKPDEISTSTAMDSLQANVGNGGLLEEVLSAPAGADNYDCKAMIKRDKQDASWQVDYYKAFRFKNVGEDNTLIYMNLSCDGMYSSTVEEAYLILDSIEIKTIDETEAETVKSANQESMDAVSEYTLDTEIPASISKENGTNGNVSAHILPVNAEDSRFLYQAGDDIPAHLYTYEDVRTVTTVNLYLVESCEGWNEQSVSEMSEVLNYFTAMDTLAIYGCEITDLSFLNNLNHADQIETLYISDIGELTSLSGLQNLTNLKKIEINGCDNLSDTTLLENLDIDVVII